MIGQTISHYTILEKLGEGGMGVVYKARDTELDRDVALKFLPNLLTSDLKERERFYHEARAASALNHPNITTIYEIKEFQDRLYLAMELVEGKTLKQLAEAEPLLIPKMLDIAIQACEGLKAAHQKMIVHRDVKSANIMLTQTDQVKIMDFGLAKVRGATKLTLAGSTIGTAAYMSPEQACGEEVDQRTDIFSIGVVFYELLTGRLPFRGEHPAALMYSIVNEEPQPISKFNEKAIPGIEQIVGRALAKDREERYQNINELLEDLRVERKRLEYPDTAYARKIRAISRPQRKLLSVGIAVAAVVVLVVIAIIFNPFNLNIGVQKNIAEPKPSLAVISFENIPDPADKGHDGEMLTNLLITAFFQTKDLDVVSRERLYDIQKDIGEGDSRVISPTVASQIARRAGVSTMMLASIIQLQPTLTVTYRVIDVETGKIINSQRVSGYPNDMLPSLADTMALMVKNDLHIVPAAISSSVADVTTRSPEAYRVYIAGLELGRRFDLPGFKVAMQKAISLDSSFAMPHYQLGAGWHDQVEIRKAWDLRANTTEKERLQIEAAYARSIEENPARAAEILGQLVNKYPREQNGYIQSYINYAFFLCDFEHSLEVVKRGLQRDSLDKELWNQLGYVKAGYNRRSEALEALDKYAQLAPGEFNPFDSRGDVFVSLGEQDSAIQSYREAFARGSAVDIKKAAYQLVLKGDYPTALDCFRKARDLSNESDKAVLNGEVEIVPIHRGELAKAGRRLNGFLELHRKTKSPLDYVAGWPGLTVGGDLLYLVMLAYEQGNYEAMLGYARERSAEIVAQDLKVPFDPTNPVNGRYEVAWALLKCGKVEEASRLMDDLKSVQRPGLRQRQREHEYFSGLLAVERGEYNLALQEFTKSLSKFAPNHAPQYHYGVALLKAGQTEDAIMEFQRMTRWTYIDDHGPMTQFSPMYNYWPIAAVKAYYWLGVAYEQQGKRAEAIKEYETFLDTWKNADFKSAEIQDARVRLAKLAGGKK